MLLKRLTIHDGVVESLDTQTKLQRSDSAETLWIIQSETQVKDNIWFTYKARIQAYTRLDWLDAHSQFLLVWYAILGAALSVITIRYPQALGPDTDIVASILSVTLLGVSLALANRDFRGRALAMRTNYRALQRLYAQIDVANGLTKEQINQYHDLLGQSENHRDIDDVIFRVRATELLPSRKPNFRQIVYANFWLAARLLLTLTLYGAPLVAAYLLK